MLGMWVFCLVKGYHCTKSSKLPTLCNISFVFQPFHTKLGIWQYIYLLIGFRHMFIILIRIFNHYNLIQFVLLVVCACCFMQSDFWRHTSTISVYYMQGKPYYVYLSNVASGLDAYSSSYIVGDISATILIW